MFGPRCRSTVLSGPSTYLECLVCLECQRAKVSRRCSTPLGDIQVPSHRFEHIHVDLISFPASRGCLTIVDRFTRCPEAVPLGDFRPDTVAHALLYHWVSRFGVTLRITTDREGQFFSDTFQKLSELLGNRRLMTTPYHPKANGLLERLHRQLKAVLHCHGDEWFDAVPVILLGLRSAWKEDLQAIPAELTYSEPLRLPGEFLAPAVHKSPAPALVKNLRDPLHSLASVPTSHHGTKPTFVFKDLTTCSHVFIRNDQARKSYKSPYSGHFVSSAGMRSYVLPEDLDQVLGPSPDGQHQQQQPQQQPQPSTSTSAAPAPSTSASSSSSGETRKKVSFNLPKRRGR
ncbi:uncharacterized protein LOC107044963 [Diachasma alloeum]|uniref:uncharacterized protein LOC107044963 n=1 Tax=Diachasma alloeum TaxID=454923 RepID=UPI0007384634|nr:uncharacterized protein LOC107044963 [Diachasma alloeum]